MLTERPTSEEERDVPDNGPDEVLAADLGSLAAEDTTERDTPSLDAETLFATALAETTILTSAEERELTRQIARARKRVRTILGKARRLTGAALADSGRGVVAPERDFRERETLVILAYAQRAARHTPLARALGYARKELRAFIAELSAALAEYRVLRDAMVRANVRLVNVLARRFHHPTLTFLDLFQEGTIGLLRAVEKYDPERNIRFGTYATWWIWQQLGRAADTQGALIRTPVHWNQLRRRVSRDVYAHAGGRDGPPSRATLAAAHGVDPVDLDTMAQTFQFMSTSGPVSEDDDRVLESMLAAEGCEPEDQALKAGLHERLEAALRQLPERERMILSRRFGLGHDGAETLEEVGACLAVSRERVRQLESRALKRLKDFCTSAGLQEYLH